MRLAISLAALLLTAFQLSAQVIEPGKPIIQIGTADGDSTEILFGVWGAARQSTGAIVIMNSGTNELRVYDARGRYVQTIGKKGRGPGEFTGLQALGVIRGDSIVTYDVFLGRVSWFSPKGQLVRTMAVSPLGNGVLPRADGFLSDGRMVAHTDFNRVFGKGPRRDTVTFVLYNGKGAPADTLGRYAGEEQFFLAGPEFSMRREVIYGRNVFAHASGNAIAVGSNDEYRFDVYDGSGKRVTTVHETAPAVRVRKNDVDAANEAWLAGMRQDQRSRFEQHIKEFPARETLPAYVDLLIGRDGSIWTGSADVSGATRVLTVRKMPGGAKRQVRVPAGFFPLDAGGDYIMGRVRDPLGIEYVNVYRVGTN